MQAALGVEHVGQAEQVLLVGAAAVVEHEQAGRLARGGALAKDQRAHGVKGSEWAMMRSISVRKKVVSSAQAAGSTGPPSLRGRSG